MRKTASKKLANLGRKTKLSILLLCDLLMGFIAWIVFGPPLVNAVATEFKITILETISAQFWHFFVPTFVAVLFMYFFGFYRSLIRFFDSMDSIRTSMLGSLIFGFGWSFIYSNQLTINTPNIVFVTFLQGFVLSVMFYALINVIRILARIIIYPDIRDENALPIIIYGAGAAGKELMEAVLIDKSMQLIAFFDDSKDLRDRAINNIPIYGSFSKLRELKKQHTNIEVLLAIPSLGLDRRREVISRLEKLKISVRTVPAFHDLIFDQKKMSDIQSLSIDDLIPGRGIKSLDLEDSSRREFLISGAGGSIGSEMVRQILQSNPKKIILLDISEFNLFKIFEETKALVNKNNYTCKIIPVLGDVKDSDHMAKIFTSNNIDTVYHAAAYKHVPLVQEKHNISKSTENNFIGTFNFALEAAKAKIKSFVLISTDKAVRPTNVMGASKRMAEISIQAINDSYNDTKLSMVRFGNVINSSGSVIPVFLDQIARGGPITITDKDVVRYFMTIPEASNLVIQAGEMSEGGEVFILDMGEQMKVYDIAKRLIHLSGRSIAESSDSEGIEIVEVGLREGEKMFEELLISGNEEKTINSKIFKSNEEFINLDELKVVVKQFEQMITTDNFFEITKIMSDHVEGFVYE